MNGVVVEDGGRGLLASAIHVLAAAVDCPALKRMVKKAKLISER